MKKQIPDQNQPTITDQLQEIKHFLKILIKDNKEIKDHIWADKGELKTPASNKKRELARKEAISYVNNIIVPELLAHKSEQGEIGTAGLREWAVAQLAQPFFNWLKTQALTYIGDTLIELKKKVIPLAVEACDWLLDKLEDYIIDKMKEADESDKEAFKEAIREHFPNSRLLGKL